MNLKTIFGALLISLGVCGIIYIGFLFPSSSNSECVVDTLIVFGIFVITFFAAGISLIRTTKEEEE